MLFSNLSRIDFWLGAVGIACELMIIKEDLWV